MLGQWSFVLLAALCAAVLALRAGRDGTAGMIAAAFLAKPQLFVWTSLGMLVTARDRVRFVIAGGLTGLAIVALGWFVLPGWLAAWSADVAPERLSRSASITVALRDVLGSPLGLGVAQRRPGEIPAGGRGGAGHGRSARPQSRLDGGPGGGRPGHGGVPPEPGRSQARLDAQGDG